MRGTVEEQDAVGGSAVVVGFGTGEGEPEQRADREHEQVGEGMTKHAAQNPNRRFAGGRPPEQGGGHGYLDMADAQQLQQEEDGGDAGDAGEYAQERQIRETHTARLPVSKSPPSWSRTSSSASIRAKPAS